MHTFLSFLILPSTILVAAWSHLLPHLLLFLSNLFCSVIQPVAYLRCLILGYTWSCEQVMVWPAFQSNSSPRGAGRQNQTEGESKEAGSQQVAQSCEVGDGEVVRVHSPSPQPPHHQAGHVEQNCHLGNEWVMSFQLSLIKSQGNRAQYFYFWPEGELHTGSRRWRWASWQHDLPAGGG